MSNLLWKASNPGVSKWFEHIQFLANFANFLKSRPVSLIAINGYRSVRVKVIRSYDGIRIPSLKLLMERRSPNRDYIGVCMHIESKKFTWIFMSFLWRRSFEIQNFMLILVSLQTLRELVFYCRPNKDSATFSTNYPHRPRSWHASNEWIRRRTSSLGRVVSSSSAPVIFNPEAVLSFAFRRGRQTRRDGRSSTNARQLPSSSPLDDGTDTLLSGSGLVISHLIGTFSLNDINKGK